MYMNRDGWWSELLALFKRPD